MPKQLYPKPEKEERKLTPERQVELYRRPFHVQYVDPEEQLEPHWGFYNSEASAKLGAWFTSRVVGFRPMAILYDRDELLQKDDTNE